MNSTITIGIPFTNGFFIEPHGDGVFQLIDETGEFKSEVIVNKEGKLLCTHCGCKHSDSCEHTKALIEAIKSRD